MLQSHRRASDPVQNAGEMARPPELLALGHMCVAVWPSEHENDDMHRGWGGERPACRKGCWGSEEAGEGTASGLSSPATCCETLYVSGPHDNHSPP